MLSHIKLIVTQFFSSVFTYFYNYCFHCSVFHVPLMSYGEFIKCGQTIVIYRMERQGAVQTIGTPLASRSVNRRHGQRENNYKGLVKPRTGSRI